MDRMHDEQENGLFSWPWLAGGLCLASAWLFGALAPDMAQSLNGPAVACLLLTSLCWAVAGWRHASAEAAPLELRAFRSALVALLPWFVFVLLMIMPYALGLGQGETGL